MVGGGIDPGGAPPVGRGPDDDISMASLAHDCLALVPAEHLSITLMSSGRSEGASAASSDVGATMAEGELTLGEGPGHDAYASGIAVVVADVALEEERWPQYARTAEVAGVRAVYAFPLHIGAARLGVLTLYRGDAHELPGPELALALAVAEGLAQALVDLQSGSRNGSLVGAIEDGAELRSVVHQATGVLAAQLGCSVEEALVRLRSAAYAADRTLSEIAVEVVAGGLRIGEA